MVTRWRLHVHDTDDTHRVTPLELLYDLVFVYALTQVTALLAHRTTWTGLLEGLIVLALLWFAWTAFAWLGNQAKADEGILRAALITVLLAMFAVALAIPSSFDEHERGIDTAVLFVLGLVVTRVVHTSVYLAIAGDDSGLRRQVLFTTPSLAGWSVLLFAGAVTSGTPRLVLWVLALAVDYVGVFVSSRVDGWRLPSASHFSERHGLIIIIAIGESLVSVGVGVTDLPLTAWVLVAAMLGVAISVVLWWLYFDVVAPVAERVLLNAHDSGRSRLARDSYTYLHFPMVVGIVFAALGVKKVLNYVADTGHHDVTDSLATVPLVAMYGGVVIYLLAHIGFRLRNVHSINRQRLLVAVLLVLLTPVAAQLPALASLALLAGVLVALVGYEVARFAEARDAVRHADSHG